LWRGKHVPINQLIEDFAKYIYLPRLQSSRVLTASIQDGLNLLTWGKDSFAYADSYDEATERYRGLVGGRMVTLGSSGLLVHPDAALLQIEAETPTPNPATPQPGGAHRPTPQAPANGEGDPTEEPPAKRPTRFHGSVNLDPSRVGRDAGRIADEVLSHLSGLVGSNVRVTLEIEVSVPGGVSDDTVRIVTENARTLKFETQGFESE
ncbi:MAG: hypothetical protein KJZ78_06305, partial [Bryobacteraceae bacterium]|nr:hypothetical protein [Bryobacteraceae bacterium]